MMAKYSRLEKVLQIKFSEAGKNVRQSDLLKQCLFCEDAGVISKSESCTAGVQQGTSRKVGARGKAAAQVAQPQAHVWTWHRCRVQHAPGYVHEKWQRESTEIQNPLRPVAYGKAGTSAVRYRKCQGRGRKIEAGNPEVRMSEACACILNISSASGCVPVPRGGCLWQSVSVQHIAHHAQRGKTCLGRRQHNLLTHLIFHFIVVFWFVVQPIRPHYR